MQFLTITVLLTSGLLVASCARKVTRISDKTEIDLSGKWNNTDSRLTEEEMIQSLLGSDWIDEYKESHGGKKPVIIVGPIINNTNTIIETQTFTDGIIQALLGSNRISVVTGGEARNFLRAERADQQTNSSVSTMKKFGLEHGADFYLDGNLSFIGDKERRKTVMAYQATMKLTNMETNVQVWTHTKKISKFVKN